MSKWRRMHQVGADVELAMPQNREEVVFTPGPTCYDVNRYPFDEKKISISIRKRKKGFDEVIKQETPSEVITFRSCDEIHAAIQPKSFSATFSCQPRFKDNKKSVCHADSVLQISDSWQATQPKIYAANFNLATAGDTFPKDPLLCKYDLFYFIKCLVVPLMCINSCHTTQTEEHVVRLLVTTLATGDPSNAQLGKTMAVTSRGKREKWSGHLIKRVLDQFIIQSMKPLMGKPSGELLRGNLPARKILQKRKKYLLLVRKTTAEMTS